MLTIDDALEAVVDLPDVMRISPQSTYADVEKFIAIISSFRVKRIILGLREEETNDHALVFVAQTQWATFLMDGTKIHMQRLPRMREVEQIFQYIERLGLLPIVEYCRLSLPATAAMPASEALDAIIRYGQPIQFGSVRSFEDFRNTLVAAMPQLAGKI